MIEGDWPDATDATLEELLAAVGWSVVCTFGERRDSRAVVLGVESEAGERYVVKHAEDREAIAWLESAHRFHTAVRHPAIPTVVRCVTTAAGFGIVEEWGAGEILSDGYNPAVLPPDHEASAYRRFLRLPVDEIVDAIDQLIDAHVAVADAGHVAVDL